MNGGRRTDVKPVLLRLARMGAVFGGALVLQVAVLSDLQVLGAMADLMLLLAIAAGTLTSPNRAALYGFAAGIAYDALLVTPFGLSALVYALAAYAVAAAIAWLVEVRPWLVLAGTALASAAAVLLMVAITLAFDLAYTAQDVASIAFVVAVWNCLLILPARRIMGWVVGPDDDDDLWMALP